MSSTNSWLKDHVSKSAPLPEGTVIMADDQFQGRGQTGNIWHSQPGMNLTFSVLLCPTFINAEDQFLLTQVISLGLNDALRPFTGDAAAIKWPNDCYIGNKKAGGILIENIIQGNCIKHSVIGIGLNVNQAAFDESLKNVTSLRIILHRDYDLNYLLGEICQAIEARYMQLRSGKKNRIRADYLERLYLLNECATYRTAGGIVEGIIRGTSARGFLQLEIKGEISEFDMKTIQFLAA